MTQNVIEELRALLAESALGPCAVHPAISRVDEMTEDGPDPVLLLAFPHDRRTEAQTFAIGKLFCRMHRHLPALLAVAASADQILHNETRYGIVDSSLWDELRESLAPLTTQGKTP